MSILSFFIIGFFDQLAVFVLSLSLHRIPIWRYKGKIVLASLVVTLISYLMRNVLNLSAIDTPLQILLFVLFLRFFIQIKLFYGSLIASTGYLFYISLQLFLLLVLDFAGWTDSTLATQAIGFDVEIIQLLSILSAYLLAALHKIFNLGLSFVYAPPHNLRTKERYLSRPNRFLFIGTILAFVVLILAFYLLSIGRSVELLILTAAMFIMLYALSIWRERHD